MKRMRLRTFGRVVARVMETLPPELLPHLDNVVVDVALEPDVRALRDVGLSEEEIADGEVIYGLFAPLDVPTGDAAPMEDVPHRLVIYKRPLEDDFPDRRQFLVEVRKTVVHELAHHFGYSDRDLERFDETDDPFGDGWVDELKRELEGEGS
jgi:predicted Zn-dependent protease with MMP-like domain